MPANDDETRKAITAAYRREYAAKNREARAAYMKEWEAKNREARNAYRRELIANNPELKADSQARAEAWAKANPEARKEHKRRYREKNREKLREAHHNYIRDETGKPNAKYKERLQRKTAQWHADLETMAGRPRPALCEVCNRPPDPKKGLHFDHCHQRGHFRGWLCRSCNLTLGYVQDDPRILLKLVAYLARTKDGPEEQLSIPGV